MPSTIEGTIDQFTGQGLMARLHPLDLSDPERAVRSALGIQPAWGNGGPLRAATLTWTSRGN
jgi:hypothetical protein